MSNSRRGDNFALKCFFDDLFVINIKQRRTHTEITLQLLTDDVLTEKLPQVSSLLEQFIPQIFEHNCFNGAQLSFAQEVKNTEIGHLFEHVLLEYISQIKFTREKKQTGLKGETYWDWNSEPRGTFHIVLSLSREESDVLLEALGKGVHLLKIILNSQTAQPAPKKELIDTLKRNKPPLNVF